MIMIAIKRMSAITMSEILNQLKPLELGAGADTGAGAGIGTGTGAGGGGARTSISYFVSKRADKFTVLFQIYCNGTRTYSVCGYTLPNEM